MTPTRALFKKDRELSDWFRGIVNQTQFEKCLAWADAELINLPGLSAEVLRGALEYKKIIMTLADVETDIMSVVPPLLNQKFNHLPPARQPHAKSKTATTESHENTPQS
jgi:hypothetical protein